MINRSIATVATTLLIAGPAAAFTPVQPGDTAVAYIDGQAMTDSALIDQAAAVDATDADAVVQTSPSTDVVLIQGGEILGTTQPIDMELTAIPGTNFGYTNTAGQVVMLIPEGRDVAIIDRN